MSCGLLTKNHLLYIFPYFQKKVMILAFFAGSFRQEIVIKISIALL